MQLKHPFRIDQRGRTASAGTEEEHLRDLIEQVLFTTPGERVNRPTFGSGLGRLAFSPNSEALAAAAQVGVQAALLQWLGDRIQVEAVQVRSEEATLRVTVQYIVRSSLQRRVVSFTREV